MTRTKVTVKKRQQRRRLERGSEKARVREAERQEQVEEDGRKEVPQSTDYQDVEDPTVQVGDVQGAFHNGGEERIREEAEDDEEEEEEEEEEEGQAKGRENDGEEGQLLLTDYEKQREQRIKENAAKLATLNLPFLASSLVSSRRPQRQSSRSKRKKDDDYVPSSSSDAQDSEDYDTDDEDPSGQQTQQDNGDLDEEQALEQAIALSLHTPPDNMTADTRSRVSRTQRSKQQVSDKKACVKKRRKGVQEQFTAEEIATSFAIIDERGKGKFSVAELERVARSHDFTWSKQEIADMIDIFDGNKDGQLDLTEFQGIFDRMNTLRMRVT